MKGIALLLLLAVGSGCRTWGTVKDFSWKVKAPAKLLRDAHKPELAFVVETYDANGQPVEGISYWWRVEWVGSFGALHKGKSFKEQEIRVKGGRGEAVIQILAYDDSGKETTVAREKIQIE